MRYLLLITLLFVLSGCAGYGANNYKTDTVLPSATKVALALHEDPKYQAIAEGIRRGAALEGVEITMLAPRSELPSDFDYVVFLTNYSTGCGSKTAGAAGAIIAGVSTALSPITITGSATSTTLVVVNMKNVKTGNMVGTGQILRSGSSLLVDCEKQLTALGESWASRQFKK